MFSSTFSASAAIATSGDLVLGLVNLHNSERVQVNATVAGYEAASTDARVLTGASLDAHNTFDDPNAVTPEPLVVTSDGSDVSISLPPHSVAVVTIGTE